MRSQLIDPNSFIAHPIGLETVLGFLGRVCVFSQNILHKNDGYLTMVNVASHGMCNIRTKNEIWKVKSGTPQYCAGRLKYRLLGRREQCGRRMYV